MSIGTKLYTWFFGKKVGSDEYDNTYYCDTNDFSDIKSKRWVMFSGEIEASKVPSHWHAWLHKSIDFPPINYKEKYYWQKKHQPNLTGTPKAYYPNPKKSIKQKNNDKKDDYEVWNP